MDASARRVLGLISEMNTRLVVPVYQRPYSWEHAQCAQLWDDVLACGRRRTTPHFTGSIVTIADGSLSPAGVAALQLIDGQQRITTIALMLIALARYDRAHPDVRMPVTCDEILMSGYLTNHFRTGADHYKLTLSKGDRTTFASLIDHLEDPQRRLVEDSPRLLDNLAFFEHRLEKLYPWDLNALWAGLQRLEVVSVALTQGTDEPQAIFESMNSTGKDLASADLIRNFVLMSYPVAEQQDMYRIYWQPIERIIGADSYDEAFDDFIRCYLTVARAPRSFADCDVYRAFKRYIIVSSYDEGGRMRDFSLRLKRFARYYVAVTTSAVEDPELAEALARIRSLDVATANPLLLALFDSFDHQILSRAEFRAMVNMCEAYLLRRAVCDLPDEPLADFFSQLVARLSAVAEEDADYALALSAMLLNEAGEATRFPDDAEFGAALELQGGYVLERFPFMRDRLGAEASAADIATRALDIWPMPQASAAACRMYRRVER